MVTLYLVALWLIAEWRPCEYGHIWNTEPEPRRLLYNQTSAHDGRGAVAAAPPQQAVMRLRKDRSQARINAE